MKQVAYMQLSFPAAVQTAKKSRPPLTAANRRYILSIVNIVHVGG
jgi:hypothetical protein